MPADLDLTRAISNTAPAGTPVERSMTAHDPNRGSSASRSEIRSMNRTASARSTIGCPPIHRATSIRRCMS
jgi:hypothetical protein